jgi:hypothetical protein
MHSYRLVAGVITSMTGLVALTASSGGCSDDSNASSTTSSTTSTSSGGGSPAITGEQCTSRCTTKLNTCGGGAQAAQGCQQFCQQSITEAQASCFEGKDCEEIARADSVDSLCPQSTGSSSGTSGASSGTSGASSGTSGTSSGALPTSVTITGSIPSATKAIHTGDPNDKIASFVSFSVKPPKFSPSLSNNLPNLAEKGLSISAESPSLGTCKPSYGLTLNSGELGVQVSGTDAKGTADCAVFTDKIASDGFKATIANVPYQQSPSTKATVKIDVN